MNEKNYKKRFELQQKKISYQSKQIEDLESKNRELQLEIEEKNKVIESVSSLKDELVQNVSEAKKRKEEFEELIGELKKMKEIMNQTVYKGRWNLIKFLIK